MRVPLGTSRVRGRDKGFHPLLGSTSPLLRLTFINAVHRATRKGRPDIRDTAARVMAGRVIWALVLNATRARILRGVAPGDGPAAPELVLRSEQRHLRDMISDKPGRSFASAGGGRRSAMSAPSDPVREDERAFVREVIAVLESHRLAGDFDLLAVFASPEMLGILRALTPDGLRARIVAETTKNLAHESERDLVRIVSETLNGKA